jgi:hypothetical protein
MEELNRVDPASKLTDAFSAATGVTFTRSDAALESQLDAAAIQARIDTPLSLRERANRRANFIEVVRQQNIERIFGYADEAMPEVVSANPVSVDFVMQALGAAQDVCDDEMQKLWGRLLAGEVAEPATYSLRTVNFLRTMTSVEAEAFQKFCRFAFTADDGWGIFIGNSYTRRIVHNSFDVDVQTLFENIGLVTNEEWIRVRAIHDKEISYFDQRYVVKVQASAINRKFAYDHSQLTEIGQQIRSLMRNIEPIPDYISKLSGPLGSECHLRLVRL